MQSGFRPRSQRYELRRGQEPEQHKRLQPFRTGRTGQAHRSTARSPNPLLATQLEGRSQSQLFACESMLRLQSARSSLCHTGKSRKYPISGSSGRPTKVARSRKRLNYSHEVSAIMQQQWQAARFESSLRLAVELMQSGSEEHHLALLMAPRITFVNRSARPSRTRPPSVPSASADAV